MSYSQARRLRWAILGAVFGWSAVASLSNLVGVLTISHSVAISLAIALAIFVVLPLSIRDAVPGAYSDSESQSPDPQVAVIN